MESEPLHVALEAGAELPGRLPEFERLLQRYFKENQFNLILDLEKINLPPARFIVTLISMTSQARRMGGDIKLINLKPAARNNLVTFSPRTYLSIGCSEQEALEEFGETFVAAARFDISNHTIDEQVTVIEKQKDEPAQRSDSNSDRVQRLIAIAKDRIRVPSQAERLYDICNFVLDKAERAGFDLRERGKIKVTIYEACLNVVEHAYFSYPDNWIDVYAGYDDQRLVVVIQDWGESFKFDPNRPYDVEQAVKERRTGGFGLHIIRRSVDEIEYLSDEKSGNRLILVKYIKQSDHGNYKTQKLAV
ncbi:MAG: ATP-binding protein [candidate division KSB1 bacterium]|nr:ATP-binding protein [candidate division KSB1 bacterium]